MLHSAAVRPPCLVPWVSFLPGRGTLSPFHPHSGLSLSVEITLALAPSLKLLRTHDLTNGTRTRSTSPVRHWLATRAARGTWHPATRGNGHIWDKEITYGRGGESSQHYGAHRMGDMTPEKRMGEAGKDNPSLAESHEFVLT